MIERETRKKEEGKSNLILRNHPFYFLHFNKLSTSLFTSIFLLFGTSCTTQKSSFEEFKKLNGSWVEIKGDSKFTETWTWKNDTLLNGSSLMIAGKDTVFSEKIQLVFHNDSVYYIPAVSNQNQGKIIRFGLISNKTSEWVFENMKHDFPTQIIYTIKEKDSLIVVVKGKEEGREQVYTFRMQKAHSASSGTK
ncbi:MAG: hypothetical protein RI883_2036 [Bacteroidota bacterium]|jgi:hypothetical protein